MPPLPRDCPCGAGPPYDACCGRYHRGAEAPDAVALMRSRYAAYATGQVEYLWRTLHPQHDDRARPRAAYLKELQQTLRAVRYLGLQVLDSRAGPDEAQVLFAASFAARGQERRFMELSTFLLEAEGWRYFTGLTLPQEALPPDWRSLTIPAFEAHRARSAGKPPPPLRPGER